MCVQGCQHNPALNYRTICPSFSKENTQILTPCSQLDLNHHAEILFFVWAFKFLDYHLVLSDAVLPCIIAIPQIITPVK